MAKIFPTDHPDSAPPGVHEISRRKGHEMIRRHKVGVAADNGRIGGSKPRQWDTMRFHKDAVIRLLEQADTEIMAVHLALYEDGTPTLVIAAEDGNAKDIKGGRVFLLNAGTPCPPDCPGEPPE